MKSKQVALAGIIFMALVTLPYLFGFLNQGSEHIFGGFLLNPIDGNSYLAKMQLGAQGGWTFQLPYSIEQGTGAFLFLFYIFLGKLAAFLNLPLIVVFHLARLGGAGFLFFTLVCFVKSIFPSAWQLPALLLVSFCSGLGWLAVFFSAVTSDVWVAEGYPFLSAYTNPHFPAGLALTLWVLMLASQPAARKKLWIAPLGLILAVILPFGVVICGVILVVDSCWHFIESRKIKWLEIFLLGIGGGLFFFYQYLAILSDPVLAAWNAQNQTPAPGLLDFFVSISPAIIFAVLGGLQVYREKQPGLGRLLLIWLVAGFLLIYFPTNLQRRFFSGYFIPCALLAVQGLLLAQGQVKKKIRQAWLILAASTPTLLVIFLIALAGLFNYQSNFYLSRDEMAGFEWLQSHLPSGSVVIANVVDGSFIPAYTSMKVVYGHDFETINAPERKQELDNYLSGKLDAKAAAAWLNAVGAKAVFFAPRVQPAVDQYTRSDLVKAFQAGDVEIYTLP